MIIADIENILDTANFVPVDGETLDELLSGCIIVGADPIDYPLTDGALLFLKDWKSGALSVLELGVNEYENEDEGGGFYIKIAKVDPPEQKNAG